MNKMALAAGAAVGFLGIVFLVTILGTLFGALGGWVVGLVFDGTMSKLATVLGIPGTPPWQLGAMLGFVGGFFRVAKFGGN